MGDVGTLQRLIPHISHANLIHDKGKHKTHSIEYASASDEGIKALQIMQLALQYLDYSQQILVQKIRTTRVYIEKQKEQVEVCQGVNAKQKSKLKSYEKALENLNAQALHYELLAKRTCPEVFQKNTDLFKELAEGNELLLRNASKGGTLYNRFEAVERNIAEAGRFKGEVSEEEKEIPSKPEEDSHGLDIKRPLHPADKDSKVSESQKYSTHNIEFDE